MATQKYTALAQTTLASGYTAADPTLSLTSGSLFPSTGDFVVGISTDPSTEAIAFLLLCTARSTNTLTVGTVGIDGTTAVNTASGTKVTLVWAPTSIDGVRADQIRTGTFAALPTFEKSGNLYLPSDSPYVLRDNGASWDSFLQPIGKVTPPPAVSSLTWGNQGTSTATETYGGFVLTPQISGSWNPRSLYKTKSSNKRFTLGFYPSSNTFGFRMGMLLWDSVASKAILFEYEMVGSNVPRFNSDYMTSLAGAGIGSNWSEVVGANNYALPVLLQYYDDGTTNRNFYSSANGGRSWILLSSQSRTANSMTPNNWGAFYNGDTNSTLGDIYVFHWLEEAS